MVDTESPRKLRKRGSNFLVNANPARQIIRWQALKEAAIRRELEKNFQSLRSYRLPFPGECFFEDILCI